MTKERAILFSGPMVRTILEGRKTQTRRVVGARNVWRFHGEIDRGAMAKFCPYGQPGDHLWVRETHFFTRFDCQELKLQEHVRYAADGAYCPRRDCVGRAWRPSIFMPRWASRITLEIVRVRVERLQDISEADAKAEGVKPEHSGRWTNYNRGSSFESPKGSFWSLWDSLNAKHAPWASNPWVWCISFRRIKP